MYFLLGASIALAAMLLMNSAASFITSVLWKACRKSALRWPAATRAALICTLRIVPVVIGIACVSLLLLPAYFTHEPRNDHEDVSMKLAFVAGFSAIGIGVALIRGFITWRATSRLTAVWLSNGTPIDLSGINIPAYRIDHQFPVIAVVGMLRPKLFIASHLLNELTDEELAAAIQHEAGHVAAHDNLKRSLMRACRDTLLLIPCGRLLDEAWKEASESAADEHAARGGSLVALDLASALVKISRLIPRGTRPAMPAAALLVGYDEEGIVSERVARLLRLANDSNPITQSRFAVPAVLWLGSVLLMTLTVIIFSEPHVLAFVHGLIEFGVHLLN